MRIVFKGAHDRTHLKNLLHVGANSPVQLSLSMNYFYLRRHADEGLRRRLELARDRGAWLMVDSGARSLLLRRKLIEPRKDGSFWRGGGVSLSESWSGKLDGKDLRAIDKYRREYLAWLQVWGEFFDVCVELDIGAVVGKDLLSRWRNEYRDLGLTMLPVYHTSAEDAFDGLTAPEKQQLRSMEWRTLCRDYKYVGVEGGLQTQEYAELLQRATDAGAKVHGFSLTRQYVLRGLPFTSAGSASWLAGQQLGVTYVLRGSVLSHHEPTEKGLRAGFADFCAKYDIDFEGLLSDNGSQVNQFNAAMWLEFQASLQDRANPQEDTPGEQEDSAGEMTVKGDSAGPGRWCDQCFIKDKCPKQQTGAGCSIDFGAKDEAADTDPLELLRSVISRTYRRLNHAMLVEEIRGGLLDPEVSRSIKNFAKQVEDFEKAEQRRKRGGMSTLEIRATGSPGVISRMFGGYGRGGGAKPSQIREDPTDYLDADVIDVEADTDTAEGDENGRESEQG